MKDYASNTKRIEKRIMCTTGQGVAYLRAADNVSGPLPIWLRSIHQPAISTCHVFSRLSPSLWDCP
jgi:hypothetical protein